MLCVAFKNRLKYKGASKNKVQDQNKTTPINNKKINNNDNHNNNNNSSSNNKYIFL